MKVDYRLRHEVDITKVLKSKKGVFDSACGLKFVKNNLPGSRFAIITSTKVSKNAVLRNKLRRQYREILRDMWAEVANGYDMLLLTSKPALNLTFLEKKEKLKYVLRKAGLVAKVSGS